MGLESRSKFVELSGGESYTGCLAMAAEFREQLRHGFERLEKMKRSNAAAGALRETVFDAEHEGGAMVALDYTAGDDSDYAAMPAFAGERQRAIKIGDGLFDALLENR